MNRGYYDGWSSAKYGSSRIRRPRPGRNVVRADKDRTTSGRKEKIIEVTSKKLAELEELEIEQSHLQLNIKNR